MARLHSGRILAQLNVLLHEPIRQGLADLADAEGRTLAAQAEVVLKAGLDKLCNEDEETNRKRAIAIDKAEKRDPPLPWGGMPKGSWGWCSVSYGNARAGVMLSRIDVGQPTYFVHIYKIGELWEARFHEGGVDGYSLIGSFKSTRDAIEKSEDKIRKRRINP